jgi:cell wall-associated NlpC family hydrolase
MTLDPRLNAFRPDLADAALRGKVDAPRYVEGRRARVVSGLVPMRRAARPDSPTDTFLHHGEAVSVFDESAGYAWCQSRRDGYVGYVETAALAAGEAPAATHFIASLGAYRYVEPDIRAPAIDFLPRHSPVAVAHSGLPCRGTLYAALDGGGFLPEACLSPTPPRSPDLAAAAALYLGCPYLWAGRSFLGIDCSGLVQEAFRDLGVAVPRDTDMQRGAIGARIAAARSSDLQRGDVLYTATHVIIYEERGWVLHADSMSMLVRRQSLREFLQERQLALSDLVVRRYGSM